MTKTQKKATGSFYTCTSIADFIAQWAIKNKDTSVLEPSFGDGIFLRSALKYFDEIGQPNPKIHGVELQKKPFDNFANSNSIVKCTLSDFMDFEADDGFDAVIGNPPYVSLRNLAKQDKEKVMSLMHHYKIDVQPNVSLWMPFVIHATEMLNNNGRLGFVLPYEITYVRYAFKLWAYLKNNYEKLSIYRIYKDFFPGVDVETVIFLAENKGGHTDSIEYKVFNTISDLIKNNSCIDTSVSIKDITSLNKPFERKLLSSKAEDIISELEKNSQLSPLIDSCKFKIGYVCGNKNYFHPSDATIKKYNIDSVNLRPCLINSKDINDQAGMGLDTKNSNAKNKLFYPTDIGIGEKKYIAFGEQEKIHLGYKCRLRKPWYITPSVETPDVILTVFGDIPKLISNTQEYMVSNSLLCGIINKKTDTTSKELVCRWYNSLTLLLIEIYVHSLGGGTLVLIPGEMDKMEIITKYPKSKIDTVFAKLNDCMLSKSLDDVYLLGDELVLKQIYGLSDSEINEIRNSLSILRSWRKPDSRR